MATIRAQGPGDLGWVFMRHAELYPKEFGYAPLFEQYVCRGLAPFLDHFDPARDRLWVAQADGRRIGAIAIQHGERAGWAQLRWFMVEQEARGTGVGRRLMEGALEFARRAGYAGVFLWTVDDLHAARRLYEAAGFKLAFQDEAPCSWAPWGHEQRWELELAPQP